MTRIGSVKYRNSRGDYIYHRNLVEDNGKYYVSTIVGAQWTPEVLEDITYYEDRIYFIDESNIQEEHKAKIIAMLVMEAL